MSSDRPTLNLVALLPVLAIIAGWIFSLGLVYNKSEEAYRYYLANRDADKRVEYLSKSLTKLHRELSMLQRDVIDLRIKISVLENRVGG